eukprot:GHVO01014763.1.p1 GENE.GHVO01014763.1~~GHVO01014763.1.p1  ORF type:complete len:418 (-),score=51.22 GHVO01014763.1:166-1419(-)
MNGTHVAGCPGAETEASCNNRRCSVWRDLVEWFGFSGADLLTETDFEIHFTDAAHGGDGTYEKHVCSGDLLLRTSARLHVERRFSSAGDSWNASDVPSDVRESFPLEAIRVIWVMKRVERVVSQYALEAFCAGYLHMSSRLPTPVSRVRYLKGCVGYAYQRLGSFETTVWMPALLEHIYFAGRHSYKSGEPIDSEFLWDLRDLFGYAAVNVGPSISKLFVDNAQLTRCSNEGKRILKDACDVYFDALGTEVQNHRPPPSESRPRPSSSSHHISDSDWMLFTSVWLPSLKVKAENASAGKRSVLGPELLRLFHGIVSCCVALSRVDATGYEFSPISLVHRVRQMCVGIGFVTTDESPVSSVTVVPRFTSWDATDRIDAISNEDVIPVSLTIQNGKRIPSSTDAIDKNNASRPPPPPSF